MPYDIFLFVSFRSFRRIILNATCARGNNQSILVTYIDNCNCILKIAQINACCKSCDDKSCWFKGEVVAFPGESVHLVCPCELVTSLYWYWHSDSLQIASYTTSPVYIIIVTQPWSSRGWYVDTANGDLVIPEVLLSDEGEYYCWSTVHWSVLMLNVHGEF